MSDAICECTVYPLINKSLKKKKEFDSVLLLLDWNCPTSLITHCLMLSTFWHVGVLYWRRKKRNCITVYISIKYDAVQVTGIGSPDDRVGRIFTGGQLSGLWTSSTMNGPASKLNQAGFIGKWSYETQVNRLWRSRCIQGANVVSWGVSVNLPSP